MKKFLSVLLALAMVASCVSMVSLFVNAKEVKWSDNLIAEPNATFEGYEVGATPTGVGKQGSTPVLTIAQDGDNKVLAFTSTKNWEAASFTNTMALIKAYADANNLTEVTVQYSADIKMETTEQSTTNSVARLLIRGVDARQARGAADVAASGTNYFIPLGTIKGYGTWSTVTAEVTLTAEDLASSDTYNLTLDGLAKSSGDTFYGYLDNVSVKVQAPDEEKPVAAQFVGNGGNYYYRAKGNFTAEDVTDDVLAFHYKVYNAGEVEATVQFMIQGGSNGWKTVKNGASSTVTLAAGEVGEVSVNIAIENGVVPANGSVEETELANLYARFDIKENGGNPSDAVNLYIFAAEGDPVDKSLTNLSNLATFTLVYEMPELPEEPEGGDPEFAEIVNGDVELGTTEGWKAFSAGTVTVVEGGANDTAHAIQYTATSNQYGSVGFLLGAAVIDDEENGYVGGGAGDYTLTFYAKAESGKGGKFSAYFNSLKHANKGDTVGDYTLTDATYNPSSGQTIEMTDEWQQFEITVNVTEEFLANLKNVLAAGATNAYDLILRLDGSGTARAFGEGTFNYFIDEVTIEKADEEEGGEEGGEGGEEVQQLPGGVRFKVIEDSSQLVLKSGANFLSASDVKNGEVTVSFPITNESEDYELGIAFALQTVATKSDGSKTWAGPNGYTNVTIAPGETEIVDYTLEVEDGKVEVLDEMYDLSTFFLRFDVLQDGSKNVEAGALQFVIGANADTHYEAVAALKNALGSAVYTTSEEVLTANGVVYNPNAGSAPGANTGDVLPVAIIAVLASAVAALAVIVIRKKKEQ